MDRKREKILKLLSCGRTGKEGEGSLKGLGELESTKHKMAEIHIYIIYTFLSSNQKTEVH